MRPLLRLSDDSGSIMMEYVLVTTLCAVPIFLVWHGASLSWFGGELNYPGIYDFSTGQLKGTGLEIQKFFQSVMASIAGGLP